MKGEGFAYFAWIRETHPGALGHFQRGIDRWGQLSPRNWWWCRGCYDWHWSPLTMEQWRSVNTSGALPDGK